jgi:hypothetical protein
MTPGRPSAARRLVVEYVPTGIHRHELRTTTPFAINLDLDGLVPGRKN